MGSAKKIDVLLSNTNTNSNPKINVVAMTKEHQFFYGTDTRGKPYNVSYVYKCDRRILKC